MTDTTAPECAAAREGLSAMFDGEEPGLAAGWLTEHLVGCDACRSWYRSARDLKRRSRLLPLPDVPRLDDRILALVGSGGPHASAHLAPRPTWRHLLPRLAAALVGVALLWVESPLLLLGRDPDAGVHPAHELGAFAVALSSCLFGAAIRPAWGRRLAPLFGGVALLLVITAGIDLSHSGRTTFGDEATHLLWVAAFLALWALPPAAGVTSGPGSGQPQPAPVSETDTGIEVAPSVPHAVRRGGAWTQDRPA